ncbi:MAG TPA: hypothetical protein VGO11_06960 [Chthoniobacteraceae bacterium]|jgi:hypothetical protein|nr:hypothetical protein [Chthoniobacteraceae bacterium]
MNRLVSVTGLLAAASGAAWLVPALAAWLERGPLGWRDCAIASVGLALILGGAIAVWWGFRDLRLASIPAPVRASIVGNGLFVSFFMLEFSDGFIRSGRSVFYWTSVLFLPALVLFYGQLTARRWAWRVARITTAIFTLWFVGFLLVIPFAHLRGPGGAVPWWGRIYVASVTLAMAGISGYVFCSLGHAETKTYYGLQKA